MDKHYTNDTIRKIIVDVTEQLRTSNYYRKEVAAQHFQGRPADVVWLHIYVDFEDISHANWICMTSWTNPSLDERFRPMDSGYQESLDGIKINWNDRYDDLKDAYQSYYTTKEDYWNRINLFLSRMREIAQEGIDLFERYQHRIISEEAFIQAIQSRIPEWDSIGERRNELPAAPLDCADFHSKFCQVFNDVDNIFLYYSEGGIKQWPQKNRDGLMMSTVESLKKDLLRLEFEEEKIP